MTCEGASSNAQSGVADQADQVDRDASSSRRIAATHTPAQLVEAERTVQQRAHDVHRPLLLEHLNRLVDRTVLSFRVHGFGAVIPRRLRRKVQVPSNGRQLMTEAGLSIRMRRATNRWRES